MYEIGKPYMFIKKKSITDIWSKSFVKRVYSNNLFFIHDIYYTSDGEIEDIRYGEELDEFKGGKFWTDNFDTFKVEFIPHPMYETEIYKDLLECDL